MEMEFKIASATVSGDYYQVVFHNGQDVEDEPYFLIQVQFEFPDGGLCYIESHLKEFIGHYKIQSALISSNRFKISYGVEPCRDAVIYFQKIETNFQDLSSTLKEMIPVIRVEQD